MHRSFYGRKILVIWKNAARIFAKHGQKSGLAIKYQFPGTISHELRRKSAEKQQNMFRYRGRLL